MKPKTKMILSLVLTVAFTGGAWLNFLSPTGDTAIGVMSVVMAVMYLSEFYDNRTQVRLETRMAEAAKKDVKFRTLQVCPCPKCVAGRQKNDLTDINATLDRIRASAYMVCDHGVVLDQECRDCARGWNASIYDDK